jgi:hypothetical protein
MLRLEDLFGIERHPLAKLVGREDKKRRKYGHRVVVKIMDALLTPGPPEKRKRSTPGDRDKCRGSMMPIFELACSEE